MALYKDVDDVRQMESRFMSENRMGEGVTSRGVPDILEGDYPSRVGVMQVMMSGGDPEQLASLRNGLHRVMMGTMAKPLRPLDPNVMQARQLQFSGAD